MNFFKVKQKLKIAQSVTKRSTIVDILKGISIVSIILYHAGGGVWLSRR